MRFNIKIPKWLQKYMPLLREFHDWLFPNFTQDTHLVKDHYGNYHAKPIPRKTLRIRQLIAWAFIIALFLFVCKMLVMFIIPILVCIVLILVILELLKKH